MKTTDTTKIDILWQTEKIRWAMITKDLDNCPGLKFTWLLEEWISWDINKCEIDLVTWQQFDLMALKPRIPNKKNSDPEIEALQHNSPKVKQERLSQR